MRILIWAIKLLLFAAVVSFAIKNTDSVTVRYYLDHEWQAPLIFVLLVAFCAGAALGVMAGLPRSLRQRREIAALRRELRSRPAAEPAIAPSDAL